MLDSMWSYGYEDALRVGLAIQDMGYYWYEDPLAEDDLYGYIKLGRSCDIPILATEHSPGGCTATPSGSASRPPTCCAATWRSKAASRR